MNNEPVAWMRGIDKAVCSNEEKLWFIEEEGSDWNYVIPLYTHPVKELHLSLQKSKQTGELLAVTYTDDEHRIVEVLWQRPSELTDEEILEIASPMFEDARYPSTALDFARAILRKAQEK